MYYFSPEHPPLTEPARLALDWAIEEKLKSGMHGSCYDEEQLVSPVNYSFYKLDSLFHLGFSFSKISICYLLLDEVNQLVRLCSQVERSCASFNQKMLKYET